MLTPFLLKNGALFFILIVVVVVVTVVVGRYLKVVFSALNRAYI
jgi:hypothetical protein